MHKAFKIDRWQHYKALFCPSYRELAPGIKTTKNLADMLVYLSKQHIQNSFVLVHQHGVMTSHASSPFDLYVIVKMRNKKRIFSVGKTTTP
jgi:hypothetical protein